VTACRLEGNLGPKDQSTAAQTTQYGIGVSTVQSVGVYSTTLVEEVVTKRSAICKTEIVDDGIGHTKEHVVEQVVNLCFQSQRESFCDLRSFEHAEVHGAHILAADPGIPADIPVRSFEERGCCIVVVNPACRCDRHSLVVVVHQPTIRQRRIRALTYRVDRGRWASCERTASGKAGIERRVETVLASRVRVSRDLRGRPELAAGVPPSRVGLVAAQKLPQETILALVPWQLVDYVEARSLRKIKTAQCLFPGGNIERILGARYGIAACPSGEDFAGIVQRLAPSKGTSPAQTVPALHTKFTLQSVVPGPGCVLTVANVPEVTVGTPSRLAGSSSRGARRDSRRNKRAKAIGYKPGKRRVSIDSLEIAQNVVAHVANLQDHLARKFMLDA